MAAHSSQPDIGVPVLTQYKQHAAELVSKASGVLTPEQAFTLIEERFEDENDLSIAMMKIKKFKINDDPAEVAKAWQSKVRNSPGVIRSRTLFTT